MATYYKGEIIGEVFYDIYYLLDLGSKSIIREFRIDDANQYNKMIDYADELYKEGIKTEIVKVLAADKIE